MVKVTGENSRSQKETSHYHLSNCCSGDRARPKSRPEL